MKKRLGSFVFAWLLGPLSSLWAHEGHEHIAADIWPIDQGLKGARELINIHPLFVHFPNAAIAVMVMSLVAGVPAYAADDAAEAVSQHEALAAQYVAKAAEQDALIAEHSPMKKEYENRFWVIKKFAKPKNVTEMEKHCNAIITNATNLRNEFLEFAQWHRMRAAELQGR